jgi:rare lipoprotein A
MIRHLIVATSAAAAILVMAAVVLFSMPVRASECINTKVSWYGREHDGRRTASGAVFHQWGLSAAMPSRGHLGERWRVSYGKRSVVVTVNDTGGFAKYGRGMDLSRGAFSRLANETVGVIRVKACRVG